MGAKSTAGPDLKFEQRAGYPRLLLAGVDEVGRGCLAGPVVAAAVCLPTDPERCDKRRVPFLRKIRDSKLMDAKQREELFPLIQEWAQAWSIASATVTEIDEINILRASHRAMDRAVEGLLKKLPPHPDLHVLVDGHMIPREFATRPWTSECLTKGDRKSLSIAASSILAKVHRDALMVDLHAQYPGYDLASNKGYPTSKHYEGLRELGATLEHRRSFKLG